MQDGVIRFARIHPAFIPVTWLKCSKRKISCPLTAEIPVWTEPWQSALSYKHVENFTKDLDSLEVRRDLKNRANPFNWAYMKTDTLRKCPTDRLIQVDRLIQTWQTWIMESINASFEAVAREKSSSCICSKGVCDEIWIVVPKWTVRVQRVTSSGHTHCHVLQLHRNSRFLLSNFRLKSIKSLYSPYANAKKFEHRFFVLIKVSVSSFHEPNFWTKLSRFFFNFRKKVW